MNEPITNPSPKQVFMANAENIKKHRDLVDSKEFERAAQFAMAEYVAVKMRESLDGNKAVASSFQMQGAHEFLQFFRLLGEPNTMTVNRQKTQNLDHSLT